MTKQKALLIAGGVAVGFVALKSVSEGINNAEGNVGQGIADAITNIGTSVGQGLKAIGVGTGAGFLLFLLLPPPFDLIGLVGGAVAAVKLATDTTVTTSVDVTPISN